MSLWVQMEPLLLWRSHFIPTGTAHPQNKYCYFPVMCFGQKLLWRVSYSWETSCHVGAALAFTSNKQTTPCTVSLTQVVSFLCAADLSAKRRVFEQKSHYNILHPSHDGTRTDCVCELRQNSCRLLYTYCRGTALLGRVCVLLASIVVLALRSPPLQPSVHTKWSNLRVEPATL